MPPHTSESPAKKQSKWSPEEDALIIELRGSGMKWDDISKRLPGRSSISCRLHYQNYLERRSEWDEERKNKLARLYERFKPEMWAKVAEEMQVPWRAAEAMHWQLGEAEMARRAGVVPFSLNMTSNEPQGSTTQRRISPTRGHHAQSHSQGSLPPEFSGLPSPHHTRVPSGPGPGHAPPPPQIPPIIPPPSPSSAGSRPLSSRRDSLPPRPPPFGPPLSEMSDYGYSLAPITANPLIHGGRVPGGGASGERAIATSSSSNGGGGGGGVLLPSLAELTTGITPYSTPAYMPGSSQQQPRYQPQQNLPTTNSPVHSSATASPGPSGTLLLPALAPQPAHEQQQQKQQQQTSSSTGKRRASPSDLSDSSARWEPGRRRQQQQLYPAPAVAAPGTATASPSSSLGAAAARGAGGCSRSNSSSEYPPTPPAAATLIPAQRGLARHGP
ncbi:hypothetical protein VTH06DRAFT_1389 [Thermothelomyces fergusii]